MLYERIDPTLYVANVCIWTKPLESKWSFLSSSRKSFICEPTRHSKVRAKNLRNPPDSRWIVSFRTQVKAIDRRSFGKWDRLVEMVDNFFFHLCDRITAENFDGHRCWQMESFLLFRLDGIDNLKACIRWCYNGYFTRENPHHGLIIDMLPKKFIFTQRISRFVCDTIDGTFLNLLFHRLK